MPTMVLSDARDRSRRYGFVGLSGGAYGGPSDSWSIPPRILALEPVRAVTRAPNASPVNDPAAWRCALTLLVSSDVWLRTPLLSSTESEQWLPFCGPASAVPALAAYPSLLSPGRTRGMGPASCLPWWPRSGTSSSTGGYGSSSIRGCTALAGGVPPRHFGSHNRRCCASPAPARSKPRTDACCESDTGFAPWPAAPPRAADRETASCATASRPRACGSPPPVPAAPGGAACTASSSAYNHSARCRCPAA